MGRDILEIYSDYLLYSRGQTTATGLSEILAGELSHDKITRFLSHELLEEKALWLKIKSVLRQCEEENACLIFDDTIIEKPYMDENDIICWHYNHAVGRTVKGINLLSAFYSSDKSGYQMRLPVGFRIIDKTEEYTDKKSGKQKRKSSKTKNEMMREMIDRQIQNQVKFKYILGDSWFSSAENMRFIEKKGKVFIFELKENRLVATSEISRNKGKFERLESISISENKSVKVWIKDLSFPVLVFKQVFRNKDGSSGQRFLVTNDLSMTDEQFQTLYKKRWGVEEYHKSLKQNASIGSSPAHKVTTQSNHIFSAIYAYIKMERLKLATNLNHFALKTKVYLASMKTAMFVFQDLWVTSQNIAPA